MRFEQLIIYLNIGHLKYSCKQTQNVHKQAINEILPFMVFESIVKFLVDFIQNDVKTKYEDQMTLSKESAILHSFNFKDNQKNLQQQVVKTKQLYHTIFSQPEKKQEMISKEKFINFFKTIIFDNIKAMSNKVFDDTENKLKIKKK